MSYLVADKPRKHLLTAVNQQPYFVQFADWKEDTVITAQANNSGQVRRQIMRQKTYSAIPLSGRPFP